MYGGKYREDLKSVLWLCLIILSPCHLSVVFMLSDKDSLSSHDLAIGRHGTDLALAQHDFSHGVMGGWNR